MEEDKTLEEVRKETEERFKWISETMDKYGQANLISWLEDLEKRVRKIEKKLGTTQK